MDRRTRRSSLTCLLAVGVVALVLVCNLDSTEHEFRVVKDEVESLLSSSDTSDINDSWLDPTGADDEYGDELDDSSASPVSVPKALVGSLCQGWCPQQYLALLECSHHGLARLRTAFQIENCHAALQSKMNLKLVNEKVEKIADNTVFVFFRGAAALFDYNMMCADPNFASKRNTMPRVISNGDCHPENFGVMVEANGALVWGVNDFDQSFQTPFTWDLKRGATGFALACKVRAWAREDIVLASKVFIDSYTSTVVNHNCTFRDTDRFTESGDYVKKNAPLIAKLFKESRDMETAKKTDKWLTKKMSIDLKKNKFKPKDNLIPLDDSEIPEFQASIDAYLYHGVAALAKYPNDGNFYKVMAVARKLGSGTGSIGLNRFYILIKGRYAEKNGYIILEMKQEVNSVLEVFFRYSYTASQEGKRAVDAVRSAWPYTNLFYGWTTYKGNSYIVREKSKHAVSADLQELSKDEFMQYSALSGRALAFYHIRARCPNFQCQENADSAVDKEICGELVRYIQGFGVAEFKQSIFKFSMEETKRQVGAWNLLRQFVNPRRGKGKSIQLLHGGELPPSCPYGGRNVSVNKAED